MNEVYEPGGIYCRHALRVDQCETCKGEARGLAQQESQTIKLEPSNVLRQINAGPRAPTDLSRQLRELADSVDRGEITELIAAYPMKGEYEFLYGASLRDALTLSILLHHRCVLRFEA